MKFGKLEPRNDYRTLRFGDYALPSLPPPPPAIDTLAVVASKLGERNPMVLYPMDSNDRMGSCSICGVAHLITMYRGLLGQRKIMSEGEVVRLYMKLTGGADTGLDLLSVLTYWRKYAVTNPSEKILAFARVNPRNHLHVMQALSLFGAAYVGFQCQQNVESDFEKGVPWTPGRRTPNGHCVVAGAYDPEYITMLTWGNVQRGTWSWWDRHVDELWIVVPREAQTPGFAPGFAVDQLLADLAAVTQ